MQIGDRIKEFRKNKKITQDELARTVGVSKNAIWNYENNKRKIDHELLLKIASALEIRVSDLLSSEDFERLSFETDFDFQELDPEILKIFNTLKKGLSESFPNVEFTNSIIVQNILIDYLAKLKVELEIYGIDYFEGFMMYDNILQTGKDLFNKIYAEYKSEKISQMRKESINLIWEVFNSEEHPETSKNLHLLISDHISYFGKRNVPVTFLKLIEGGGQDNGS